ncbi:MAG TPA: AAA family ATPase [Chloroflexi bacterium]|nr:AAA family ATPase [Chloroflexota bacterium]
MDSAPPAASLHVWLLGGLRVTWDGHPINAFESDKARALFCYLLLEARPIRREQLVGLFWGEQPEARARGNLSRVLSNLRDLFPACVSSDRTTVALIPPTPFWVDVHSLRAAYRAVEQTPDAPDAHAALHTALELYQGPLLAGFSLPGCPEFEEWQRIQQEHWHTLALTAWEWQTAYHRQRGEWEAALACARSVLELEPWRERAHRQLMLLLALQGEREAALHQYEQCRRILATELGVTPTAETETLRQRIADATTDDAEMALVAPQPLALPFVGRASAHRWLSACWEAARHGAGGLTLVAGEAGIGKSRLVQEALRFVAGQGVPIFSGRCFEFNRAVPYQAIHEALRPLLTDASPSADTPLWRLLQPGVGAPTPRTALFAAIAAWLPGPAVLFLDDLQWADVDTLDLLHYLVRNPGGVPRWLIGAYRPEECPPDHPLTHLAQTLNRDALLQTLTLDPLTPDAVTELTTRLFGDETRLAAYLFQESAGNPFLIGELLETLRDQAALRVTAGGWEVAGELPTDLPLSARTQDMILQRTQRLDETAQYLLHLAAAHGRPFDAALLAAAGECAASSVTATLHEWQARRLARPVPAGWDFAHDKIRAALYQSVPPPLRRLLHARLVTALEVCDPQNVSALAYHCDQAQQAASAARYLLQAGDQARLAYAHEQSVACYQRGLELTDDVTVRYALLSGLESVYDMASRREEQRTVLEELAALVTTAPFLATPRYAGEVALRQAHYAEATSDYRAAAAAAARVVALAQQADDGALLAAGYQQWGYALRRLEAPLADAAAMYARACAAAERAGAQAVLVDSLQGLANVAWQQGDYATAKAHLAQSLALCQELGDRRGEADAYNIAGLVAQREGDLAAAQAHYARALELRRAIGDRRGQGLSHNNLGSVALALDEWDAAEAAYHTAAALCRTTDDRWGLAIAEVGLAEVALARRQMESARQYAIAGLAGLEQVGATQRAAQSRRLLTRITQATAHQMEQESAGKAPPCGGDGLPQPHTLRRDGDGALPSCS